MYIVDITIDTVLEECPFVRDWISALNTFVKGSDFPVSKIEAYYEYGFFVPASKNNPEQWAISQQKGLAMAYDDRLASELSKVRVTLGMKLGHTALSHRLNKGFIPASIRDIIAEITKIRMRMEYDHHGDKAIFDSIPPANPNIIVEFIDESPAEEPELDVDDILDKISNSGVESLTKEEKEFLDKKSKDY
jgi:hypothetical protein